MQKRQIGLFANFTNSDQKSTLRLIFLQKRDLRAVLGRLPTRLGSYKTTQKRPLSIEHNTFATFLEGTFDAPEGHLGPPRGYVLANKCRKRPLWCARVFPKIHRVRQGPSRDPSKSEKMQHTENDTKMCPKGPPNETQMAP